MVALIAGSSGLVGNYLLKKLIESDQYTEIISLVRRPGNISNPKVRELVIDFDNLSEYASSIGNIDVAFCCLGTTMKQAGSKSQFYKVDFEYVYELGKLAKSLNAQTFVLNSALGADKNSLFFYNRVKGQIEDVLWGLNFPNLVFVRPSLLLGQRKEVRLGEKIGEYFFKWFRIFFVGFLRKYKAIPADTVAKSMLIASFKKGKHIIESNYIDL